MSLGEIAAAVRGDLHADPASMVTAGVCIDSRQAESGSLFVALPGERVDGHDFAASAVASGAAAVLASHAVAGLPAIVVADPVVALADLAAEVLSRSTATVIGITGSSGKTTTKDLIAAMLAARAGASGGDVVAAAASYNNEIGFPLTVTRVTVETRFLVLEYAARGIGHIASLARIARPHVAGVINVGSAHLGEFGDADAIAKAKGELAEAVDADGTVLLNLDDHRVAAMRSRTAARVMGVGEASDAELRITDVSVDSLARASFSLSFAGRSTRVSLHLPGRHLATNAAIAAGVGLCSGLTLDETSSHLSAVSTVSPHRMQIRRSGRGLVILDDAYNANPESMSAAIAALAQLGQGSATWAVLGPMRELGPASESLHAEVGREVAKAGIDVLVAVGEETGPLAEAAGPAVEVHRVPDTATAIALLKAQIPQRATLLVKASNALRLWEIADAVMVDEETQR